MSGSFRQLVLRHSLFSTSITRGMSWPDFYQFQAARVQHPALRDFYAAGLPAADTPLSAIPMMAMDFETTGLDANGCDIVSIGLVPMTLERIRNSQSIHWIVRPRTELCDESVVFHGITHSAVNAAPDLSLFLSQLLEQLRGRVVIAHCCSIERSFLDQAVKARWGEGVMFPMIDTMAIENSLTHDGFIERMFGGRSRSIRLADCRQRYGLPFYHPHHAQIDALACAELFQAQVATHYSPGTPIGRLWQ
jgi:DNA polymerase III subunit epsilon